MNKSSQELPEVLQNLNDLIQAAKGPQELADIGAGRLEDLLQSKKGEEHLPLILEMARKDQKWRYALGCVWTSNFKNRALAEQIDAANDLYFPKGRP